MENLNLSRLKNRWWRFSTHTVSHNKTCEEITQIPKSIRCGIFAINSTSPFIYQTCLGDTVYIFRSSASLRSGFLLNFSFCKFHVSVYKIVLVKKFVRLNIFIKRSFPEYVFRLLSKTPYYLLFVVFQFRVRTLFFTINRQPKSI